MVIENKNMPPEIRLFADFANSAYKTNIKERTLTIPIANWYLNSELSTVHEAVWINDVESKIVLALRGTVVSDPKDLIADAAIAVASSKTFETTVRFKNAVSKLKIIKENYPNYNIIVSGHSLGGTLANTVYKEYENSIQKAYTYNPGSGAAAVKSNMWNAIIRKKYPNIYGNFIKGDPISFLGVSTDPNTKIYTPVKGVFPHLLSNFTNKN